MSKPVFRVKPYAHDEYKFVVRAKINGAWKRRYFRTEDEATAYAAEQNSTAGSTEVATPKASPPRRDVQPKLNWTGERVVTTCGRPIAYEHVHRYAVACAIAKGRRVLDIASGEGYGANLLAQFADDVIGVDADADAVEHASAKYTAGNLRFVRGLCEQIPLGDGSVDLVASFETLEHTSEHERFIAEVKRVLRPRGVLVISSPDRIEYGRSGGAANPFHKRELSHDEFMEAVRRNFRNCIAARQRLVVGSWIAAENAPARASTFHGSFEHVEMVEGVDRGLYSIAICSDGPLPDVRLGVFEDVVESAQTWDLLDRYETPAKIAMRIAELERDAEEGERQLAARDAADAERIHQMEAEKLERENRISTLHGEVQAISSQLADAAAERDRQADEIARLQRRAGHRSRRIFFWRQKYMLRSLELVSAQQLAEEREREIANLQSELHRRSSEVAAATAEKARLTEDLNQVAGELKAREAQSEQEKRESVDRRWEVLTLRAELLRRNATTAEAAAKLTEAENATAAATSERDNGRAMLAALQLDLEQERLNVRALQRYANVTEERAIAAETACRAADARADALAIEIEEQQSLASATAEDIRRAAENARALQNQLDIAEDRAGEAERRLRAMEARATAAEAQLHDTVAQQRAATEQLRATSVELAKRRKQILHLRERLTRRLILPFGKAQRTLAELTE